jgi:hypothetical protein
MPRKKFMGFINNIQTSPSLFPMEFLARRGGDVMDTNAMRFIPLMFIHDL